MAASPLQNPGVISSQRASQTTQIPAAWRAKQAIGLALIALLAIWYALVGWHSPGIERNAADNASPFDFLGFALLGTLIWLTTPTTWTIAATSFQEAIRRRWMTALLGFAVVMLAVSTFFTWMQPGEEQKFLRDYGIGFTVIMTLIAAIFLGVAMIPPEVERRTIFTILSKPVTRLEFLLGKYIGLMFTLLLNLIVMSVIFLLAYAVFVISKEGFSRAFVADGVGISKLGLGFDLSNLAKALFLHLGTLSIMAAFAVMLSQFLTGISAIICCFLVYFLGQSASYWERLAGGTGEASQIAKPALSPALRAVVDGVYAILPRLDRFDVRERLVNDLPVGLNYLAKAGASGAIYTAVLLCVSYFVFSDREF
ncbi:ABC-2 family transporter protein [Abditibacterium utsteinense]|uniref:ABC-2 family transporter protein n=1 Tax=Abditibacterium utsteinense TaxID=1960156 RepID=A0A2S8SW06_9BACT|nr:ABC transporter permease subunit [Abditibacterium utsteinense]PQV64976.1 ABC-2 family transporter protein [Abditibacterium utsteinense]